jgi:hypothetical protein
VDNGSEFCSRALEACSMTNQVQCFIRPGRPVETGFIESFNGRLRDECLNVEWFSTLEDARQKLAKLREHYNRERPHSALADRTLEAYAPLHRGKATTLMGETRVSQRDLTTLTTSDSLRPRRNAAVELASSSCDMPGVGMNRFSVAVSLRPRKPPNRIPNCTVCARS